MRDQLLEWVTTYPKVPGYKDRTFAGAPVGDVVRTALPEAIRSALPDHGNVIVRGSVGQSDWAHTPWVALLHPEVTTTVQEGYYVVYLLSRGCERLYLTIAQGCTELMKGAGEIAARDELTRRATRMRGRIRSLAKRLKPLEMSLDANYWRARLYEAGLVVGAEYDASELPSDSDLLADLREALALYRHLRLHGGYCADGEMIVEAREERGSQTLEQAKRYRQHRAVERQSSHSRKVKRLLGTRCMGCGQEMAERYGPLADGIVDAHHLTPLESLAEGNVARFDPEQDFAVLCPNCHRVIHRLDDPSDLERLREIVVPYRAD